MSTVESLQKELELTKAELVHANETIVLLAKGDEKSATQHVHVELQKTKELCRLAQDEIRALKVKKGLLGTENRKLTKKYDVIELERSKFQSMSAMLQKENDALRSGGSGISGVVNSKETISKLKEEISKWQSKYTLLKKDHDELNKNLTFVLTSFRENA